MEEKTIVMQAVEEVKGASEEDLEVLIAQHFDRVRMQGLHLGASYISAAVYGAIEKNLKNGLNSSLRDFKRMTEAVLKIVSVQLQNTQQNDFVNSEDEASELEEDKT